MELSGAVPQHLIHKREFASSAKATAFIHLDHNGLDREWKPAKCNFADGVCRIQALLYGAT